MPSLLAVRIQKLFLITIILKVGASFLGWYFQLQWSLGFWVPLSIMALYIVLGLKRRDREVTDEKFADSCYYLGFIFTITSIIFSLFDLPNIGTKMQDIAVRFGAAMVSTVAGLVVRVYLVSFKKDVADAIKDAEDAVIDASQKFREQLVLANERLRDFQSAVDIAAKETVERVNMQVESLSRNHAEKLTAFFGDLTARNQEAFTDALTEVRAATMRLSKSVDNYSVAMGGNLGSIEAKVSAFAEAVTLRLQNTTFPDDYFVRQLEEPLRLVKEDAVALSSGVKQASSAVAEASTALGSALKKLKDKSAGVDDALDSVLRLTSQQQAILDAAQGQLGALERVESSLSRFDAVLDRVAFKLEVTAGTSTEVVAQVQGVISEIGTARESLESSLQLVLQRLGEHSDAAEFAATRIDASTTASQAIASNLRDSAKSTDAVLSQLREIAVADVETGRVLHSLRDSASSALERFDVASQRLAAIAVQLGLLDASVKQQTSEVKSALARVEVPRLHPLAPSASNGWGHSSPPTSQNTARLVSEADVAPVVPQMPSIEALRARVSIGPSETVMRPGDPGDGLPPTIPGRSK